MLRKIPLSLKVVKTLNDNIYGIRNIRSQDYSFPGTFVPWTVRSMELSFPGTVVPGTTLDLSCRGPFVYLSAEQYNGSGTA